MKASPRSTIARWWSGEGGLPGRALSVALWPAEQMFAGAAAARNAAYEEGWLRQGRAPIPVVSVGNLRVGGAGKTPVTAWIAARYEEWGVKPAVVMRGYGEDEVLVHGELNPSIPVYIAARRLDGVLKAAEDGRTVAVLDDAFQHRAIARDLDLVLIAAESWSASRRLLPRGPWRETTAALRRADVVMITRKSASAAKVSEVADELSRLGSGASLVACSLLPDGLRSLSDDSRAYPLEWLQGRAVAAVASLADPTPFVEQLEQLGAEVEPIEFPDHHAFSANDVKSIHMRAGSRPIVMTGKEAVKLRSLMGVGVSALVLRQRVVIESGEDELIARLKKVIPR